MNITCLHCGGSHALFWYQSSTERKLSYLCDKFEQKRPNKLTGTPEVRRIKKRLAFTGKLTPTQKKAAEDLPVVYSKPVLKKESDAHQERLQI